MYDFIYIKAKIDVSDFGENRKKALKANNEMAQEIKNSNIVRKTSLTFNKDFKKILLKKTAIDFKRNTKVSKTKINPVLKLFNVNNKMLFNELVSTIKLKEAWHQINNTSSITKNFFYNETTKYVNDSWFENLNGFLVNGTFRYLGVKKKLNLLEPIGKNNLTSLSILNPRVKIIEKSLLNFLEVVFEGIYIWITISKKEFMDAKANLKIVKFNHEFKTVLNQKPNKYLYKKKYYIVKKVFKSSSFGYRPSISAHHAFYHIKTEWYRNTVYFLDYDIKNTFINISRLKNTFNRYVLDLKVWEELKKILALGYIQNDIKNIQNPKVSLTSVLSCFLLNIYMHDFDQFMEDLDVKHLKNNKITKVKWINKRIQYIRYANEIIIGIIDSKKFARWVQKSINNFMCNNLHLVINKTKIFHRDQFPITFLGHQIKFLNFWKNPSVLSKQVKTIQKFKNKMLQKLKLEEPRIAKIKKNKFRKKVLRFIDLMSQKLNLNHTKRKEFNFLVSLFAYKFLGDILAKVLNFSSFEKLINFLLSWNNESELITFLSQKVNFIVDQNIILNKIGTLINGFKHFNQDEIEKVAEIVNEIEDTVQLKTKALLNSITIKNITKVYKNKKNNALKLLNNHSGLRSQGAVYISIRADIKKLCNKLRLAEFLHPFKNQASSCSKVLILSEQEIIQYYDSVIREILSWFSGTNNFLKVKGIVESVIRLSCLFTLKRKFKLKSMAEAINIYTKNVKIVENKIELISKEKVIKWPNTFNKKAFSDMSCNKKYLKW